MPATPKPDKSLPGLPYVVPYRIVGSGVRILRVYHTARRWPARL
jgi:plasmid stabilization system protein ParE